MKGYELLNFQFGFEREHDALQWIRRKSQIRCFVAYHQTARGGEKAGVEFMAENGEGSGVRLAKRAQKSK
jgi:hypothetical protein